MGIRIEPHRGVYDANRASALSGVPKSTLHYWARHEILVPSVVSAPRTRLWSWGDLLVLRLLDWLRSDKAEVSASSMPEIRRLVDILSSVCFTPAELAELVAVSDRGRIFVSVGESWRLASTGQFTLGRMLRLTSPYEQSPDLLKPRPALAILPGKLSGQPHIQGSRVPTLDLYVLNRKGYAPETLADMFAGVTVESIWEAIEFERSLSTAA